MHTASKCFALYMPSNIIDDIQSYEDYLIIISGNLYKVFYMV